MFSVPGWNVSAPLTAQIEKPKAKDATSDGKSSKNGKKRKRQQEEQITEGNLGELWNKVAAAEKSATTQGPAATIAEEVEAPAEAPAEAPRKKPRKRSKKKKEPVEGNAQITNSVDADMEDVTTQEDTAAVAEAPIAISEKPAAPQGAEAPTTTTEKPTTDAEKAKRDKKQRKQENRAAKAAEKALLDPPKPIAPTKLTPAVSLIPEPPGLTPMQRSMRTKLASARFRHLNESLYTKPSKESLEIFKETPSMFEDYHRGFAQQVEVWPENPVDGYVSTITARGKARTKDPRKDKKRALDKKGKQGDATDIEPPPRISDIKPLPRNLKGVCTIADLGCGVASLSHTLQPQLKPLNLVLHSFDLAKPTGPSESLVTVADISALPLPDNAVDVAIFCLALMGTNWLDFIDEAWRVLRWRGELWIAEIKSRFGRVGTKSAPGKPPPNSVGLQRKPDKKAAKPKKNEAIAEGAQNSDDETELAERIDGVEAKEGTDVSAFVEVMRKHGFVLDALPEKAKDAIDLSNKMFVKLHFVKAVPPTKGKNAKEGADRPKPGANKDMRMSHGMKGKKYAAVAEVDDKTDEKDAKVLKPCLYKIR
ncbi:hypothetical protein K504DRAFT_460259 [Pleomassaria siparia CBS 279.74]|uniref:Ribosomal RNA-processing protein 8 n=1 Tax=Pleomassaria siparia CBS 279.74 TaxID=1314801 RepID=A0A6G1JYV1_9PLEO|nr:hypothetical protein K504DRAFT_460259 [Pleomassaria siparia CBS 279.74]